jgi:tRNA(Arg) A34 adenosine deaminase TadA
MCRQDNISNQLHNAALCSTMSARHGAIITKGSHKPIYTGHNKKRSKQDSYLMPSTHAEIDVARRLYNYYKRRTNNKRDLNRIMSKFTIWVGRILRNDSLSNSEPCNDCCRKLKSMGFTRLGYTTETGSIVIVNLTYYNNTHLSKAQRALNIK